MSDTLWQSSVQAAVAQSQLLSVWVAVSGVRVQPIWLGGRGDLLTTCKSCSRVPTITPMPKNKVVVGPLKHFIFQGPSPDSPKASLAGASMQLPLTLTCATTTGCRTQDIHCTSLSVHSAGRRGSCRRCATCGARITPIIELRCWRRQAWRP